MSADEMQAKSYRFGGGALCILPLESGKWAIFRDQDLISIQDHLDEGYLKILSDLGKKSYELRKSKPKPSISLEDLGL